AGGLVGRNTGILVDCHASGSVTGQEGVGGLVGYNEGTVTRCCASGPVQGDEKVGGLAGFSNNAISNCYATGSVNGRKYAGGLVGHIYYGGGVTHCYATGAVSASEYVGGLVGDGGYARECFWDVETSRQTDSDGGNGRTTAEMQSASTFRGWASCRVETAWTIDEGNDYPRLGWEHWPGEPILAIALSDILEGTGTEEDPYLIYTAEELNLTGWGLCDLDKHFRLMADIDLSAYAAADFNIIGVGAYHPFTGVFDGNGHVIANFSYGSARTGGIGLFAQISDPNAEVKNLGLIVPRVHVPEDGVVGALVGNLISGRVANCHVDGGMVSASHSVGGLVGCVREGEIADCHSTGSVVGGRNTGGLVGVVIDRGFVTRCSSASSVVGGEDSGGLLGYAYYGVVTNCCAAGTVFGNDGCGGLLGGIYHGNILNCYAAGNVFGHHLVGGLVGHSSAAIRDCHATATVIGADSVGGLLGKGRNVTTSFWNVQTTGQTTSAGGGTGLTMAEMQNTDTFVAAGWEFFGPSDGPSDVWTVDTVGFPILWWQVPEEEWPPLSGFSGGTGERETPYRLGCRQDLNSIGHNPRLMESHFELTGDIDMESQGCFPLGSMAFPFAGVFEGNGCAVIDLNNHSTQECVGLFACVSHPRAEIRNVTLIDPNFVSENEACTGALIGYLDEGAVVQCFVKGGTISGSLNTGGLVGLNHNGVVADCGVEHGNVSGHYCVGGLVGKNGGWIGDSASNGTLSNCHMDGVVIGEEYVGGLAGSSGNSIVACSATGVVGGHNCVGGLAGYSGHDTSYSWARSEVSGHTRVGGLIGKIEFDAITNCYARGVVEGSDYVGGLIGQSIGPIKACYSAADVTGDSNTGGLVGYGWSSGTSFWDIEASGQDASTAGQGLTTVEMM
ncbi:MAG: hypothetical protein JSW27_05020, partial [Phycisphaerales bacterium]